MVKAMNLPGVRHEGLEHKFLTTWALQILTLKYASNHSARKGRRKGQGVHPQTNNYKLQHGGPTSFLMISNYFSLAHASGTLLLACYEKCKLKLAWLASLGWLALHGWPGCARWRSTAKSYTTLGPSFYSRNLIFTVLV